MAARSGWINWDALGEEAEEDAAGLNYDYEFVVIDPEEEEDEVTASSHRRRGGRLGLAGGVRSGRGHGRAPSHVHGVHDGGHHDARQAVHVNGQVSLMNSRHGLAHRVRSIVYRTTVPFPGEGSSRGRAPRVGLSGRKRVPAPVTQWLRQHVPSEGGSSSDTEEHVEDEPEEGANEEGMENGEGTGGNGTLKRKRTFYKLHEKQSAYAMLLERTSAGVLSRGVSLEVSSLTGIPVRTLVNWWTKCKTHGLDGLESKRGHCGRKKLPFDAEAIKLVELSKRTTLHDLAVAMNMSKSTLWRRLNEGLFRRHTNAIKSTLTDANKVMFLAAVARPRFDANGNVVFDGKLGIWPFTYQEAAKRKSKNREAGTIVTKVLPAVTQSVSRDYMIGFLLPAIKQRWPAAERGTTIWIQQDNAKTHIPVDDPEFVAAAQADGWDIRLTCQPPNSPDLNILDLGFFAALQSMFHKLSPGSVDDIVQKVQQAYAEYPAERSNKIFLTLQACMREVIQQLGGNRYKVPHMRKEVLQRLGTLPVTLKCTANFVKWAIDSLEDA